MGFAIAYLEIPNFFNIPRGASKLSAGFVNIKHCPEWKVKEFETRESGSGFF